MLDTSPRQRTVAALFASSQTLRRIAHEHKRSALEAERDGYLKSYRWYRDLSNRAWRKAKRDLQQARIERS